MIDSKDNILTFGTPTGTIEIHPQPEEILDVDPEILAVMNAKLRGESLDDVYDRSDRVTQEFLVRKETEKLRRVFTGQTQVFEAFSSLSNLKGIRRELQFEEVNRDLLAEYSLKKSGGTFIDEVDVYASLLTCSDLAPKRRRVDGIALDIMRERTLLPLFMALKDTYLGSHFDPLGVSKELIQLQPTLQAARRGGRLLDGVNSLLHLFYREIA